MPLQHDLFITNHPRQRIGTYSMDSIRHETAYGTFEVTVEVVSSSHVASTPPLLKELDVMRLAIEHLASFNDCLGESCKASNSITMTNGWTVDIAVEYIRKPDADPVYGVMPLLMDKFLVDLHGDIVDTITLIEVTRSVSYMLAAMMIDLMWAYPPPPIVPGFTLSGGLIETLSDYTNERSTGAFERLKRTRRNAPPSSRFTNPLTRRFSKRPKQDDTNDDKG